MDSSHKLDKKTSVDFPGDLLARFGRVRVIRSCDDDMIAEDFVPAGSALLYDVSAGSTKTSSSIPNAYLLKCIECNGFSQHWDVCAYVV
eukprot:SAG31_NODE_394_length_16282_cov_132.890564_7_plen_89_part_00